jgi:hypothetical protein
VAHCPACRGAADLLARPSAAELTEHTRPEAAGRGTGIRVSRTRGPWTLRLPGPAAGPLPYPGAEIAASTRADAPGQRQPSTPDEG